MKKLFYLLMFSIVLCSCSKDGNKSSSSGGYVDLNIDGVAKSRINIANIGGTGFGPSCTKKIFEQHVVDSDNSEYSISISFLHAYYDKDFQEIINAVKSKTISQTSGVISPSDSYCGYSSLFTNPYIIISYVDVKSNTIFKIQTFSLDNINSIENITKISSVNNINNYVINGSFKSTLSNISNNKFVKINAKYKIYINTVN